MRQFIVIFLLSLSAFLYSNVVNAYVIHNNTGIDAYFQGETCPSCFKGTIASGDWGACPGSETGCGGTTSISIVIDHNNDVYFGEIVLPQDKCSIQTPVPVTAHGDVYAYRDHVVVADDEGNNLYNGQWSKLNCKPLN